MEYELCRHIKTNGDRCNSPRLLTSAFCYFHKRLHDQHTKAIAPQRNTEVMLPVLDKSGTLVGMEPAPQQTIDIGPLEDRASVQMAISTVLNALASGRLDQSRATALLYGLQLASTNCIRKHLEHAHATNPVTEVEITPEGELLAPRCRVRTPQPRAIRKPPQRKPVAAEPQPIEPALTVSAILDQLGDQLRA